MRRSLLGILLLTLTLTGSACSSAPAAAKVSVAQVSANGLQVTDPTGSGGVHELPPQESFTTVGVTLPADRPEFTITVSYRLDGMPHHGKAVYQIKK